MKKQKAKGKILVHLEIAERRPQASKIKGYSRILKQLSRIGADSLNPKSVKEIIAKKQG